VPDLPPAKRRPLSGGSRGGGSSAQPYAELHCRTNFSFLEGASHPDELVQRAAELGYAALAIADRNSVAGVVRAHAAAKEAGLKLLIGAEVTPLDAPPVVLLATDRKAYGNLCRLLTVGRRRAPKGECELTFTDVAEHAEGLLACVPLRSSKSEIRNRGENPKSEIRNPKEIRSTKSEFQNDWDRRNVSVRASNFDIPSDFGFRISNFASAFPGRCYALAELHRGPNDRAELQRMMWLAADAGVPLVASNDVHYHVPQRRFLQDVLTAIRHGCTVAELGGRMFPNAERYLKSAGQMRELFADCPDAVARTAEVAARCTFSLDELRYEYPHELCPPGTTPFRFLERLTWDGAHRRFPRGIPAKVRGLIEHELRLIEELRYETYFLTVWDLVRFARGRGILCQGRGSAANSVVCYCLEVTSVDPERIDVLFERFISKERDEAPDIDVDFEHERREEVIQYVYEKYGRERAGMAATVICYRARSAVRDVGKALGLSLDRVDVIAKSMSHVKGNPKSEIRNQVENPKSEIRNSKEIRSTKFEFQKDGDRGILDIHASNFDIPSDFGFRISDLDSHVSDDQFASRVREGGLDPQSRLGRQFVALVREILDFPRHLSQHVGGLVLTEGPLCELVPIENAAMADRTVIQWDKDDLDTLGLLKVDCLALGMLTAIRKAFDFIADCGLRIADLSPLSPCGGLSSPDGGVTGRGAGGEGTPSRDHFRLPDRPPSPRPSPPEAGGEGDQRLAFPSSPQPLISSSLRPSDLPTFDSPGRLTLATVPPEDPAVYEMIRRADTLGVFQIESRAQMSMLPRLRPNCYYDLVIEVAIVRPGPIQGDMVHPYLRRRSGEEPVDFPDERIREVLEKTLGVPIFQEQAMRLAVVAAGFTPGEADQLRRAMGAWRKRGVMEKFRRKLIDGMHANGYSAEFAERLFKQISGFGEYGFPESHAASFALLVYVSAWLKRHHPAAFTAALLNSQPMGFYAPAQLVDDARKHGVEVREVDVNFSGWDCGLEVGGIADCGLRIFPPFFRPVC
jgi:error-prone DNA polymerase